MKKIVYTWVFLAAILASSCTKSSCEEAKNGVLKNYTGLDGCGWVIVLKDGTKLEPTNLSDFDLDLSDGMKISLRYEPINGLASICMVGELVKIVCLEKK